MDRVGLAFAATSASAVPRTSIYQSPHTLIVSFRTDRRFVPSVRALPAFDLFSSQASGYPARRFLRVGGNTIRPCAPSLVTLNPKKIRGEKPSGFPPHFTSHQFKLRPQTNQVRNIHTSQPTRTIPIRRRRIRHLPLVVRSRKQPKTIPRRQEAVIRPIARNVVISHGHVMKHAPVVVPRQVVIQRIRISLRSACLLIDQRLNACKLRRRKRSPASTVRKRIQRHRVITRRS